VRPLAKISLVCTLLILVLIFIFYFWGSNSNYDVVAYYKINDYSFRSDNPNFDTLSVVSYNIGYLSGMNNNISVKPDLQFYDQNLNKVKALFKKYHPSFIGFQEIDFYSNRSFYRNQLDSIASYSGYNYGAEAINWDKKYIPFPYWPPSVHFGRMLSGQGILSQFPIIENKRIVLPKPEDNPFYFNAFYLDRLIQISKIKVGDRTLILINIHLEAFDKNTRECQAEILKDYVFEYIDQYPLLLIGDFNCRPPFKGVDTNFENTIRSMMNISGMVTAITEEVYIEDPARYLTFSSDAPYEKLDYIFYNYKFIEKLDAGTIHEADMVSDHLPVYMKFILKGD